MLRASKALPPTRWRSLEGAPICPAPSPPAFRANGPAWESRPMPCGWREPAPTGSFAKPVEPVPHQIKHRGPYDRPGQKAILQAAGDQSHEGHDHPVGFVAKRVAGDQEQRECLEKQQNAEDRFGKGEDQLIKAAAEEQP